MKVLFCFADTSTHEMNTSWHRIVMPMKMMIEAGHECRMTHVMSLFVPQRDEDFYGLGEWNRVVFAEHDVRALYGKEAYDAMRWADVVVIERLVIEETWQTIRWLKVLGKRVYCTFDDGYHLMPVQGAVKDAKLGMSGPQGNWRGGRSAREGKGSMLYEFREGLKLCDGALVPSRLLADDYRRYQKNMRLVPNYLYAPLWESPAKKNPDMITIGYGASSLHFISLRESGVIPALKMICDKYPKVSFYLQPPNPDMVEPLLAAGVRLTSGPYQKFQDWPKTVMQFNIGIAPMSGEYDARRSSLKALEYATGGVPWVATDSAPYEGCRGGLLVKNKKQDWFRALDSLIANQTLYQDLSRQGKEWAVQFNSQCAQTYEEALS